MSFSIMLHHIRLGTTVDFAIGTMVSGMCLRFDKIQSNYWFLLLRCGRGLLLLQQDRDGLGHSNASLRILIVLDVEKCIRAFAQRFLIVSFHHYELASYPEYNEPRNVTAAQIRFAIGLSLIRTCTHASADGCCQFFETKKNERNYAVFYFVLIWK